MRKIGIIGIGGFGRTHVNVIMNLVKEGALQCVAFAELNPDLSKDAYEKLTSIGAKHYFDYKEMLDVHNELDFVTIATPIPLHKEMSIWAMEKGFNVLLEKPPVVTIQDFNQMLKAQHESGRLCAVNFQNTTEKAFRLLIEKIRSGVLGEIKNITGVGMWKRTQAYYERTSWAGKLIVNGKYILDGTINNPFAHLLNNCLIIAGYGDAKKAIPKWVQGELYKGHNIEGEDTSCLKIGMDGGTEVRFYATLCNSEQDTPFVIVEGSQGRAFWDYNNTLKLTDCSGNEECYSFPEQDNLMKNIYLNFIEVLNDDKKELFSPIENCRSFVLASNGAFESSRDTYKVPEEFLVIGEEDGMATTYIKDIETVIHEAYKAGKLFSEISVEWAVKTQLFSLEGYEEFNLYR